MLDGSDDDGRLEQGGLGHPQRWTGRACGPRPPRHPVRIINLLFCLTLPPSPSPPLHCAASALASPLQ